MLTRVDLPHASREQSMPSCWEEVEGRAGNPSPGARHSPGQSRLVLLHLNNVDTELALSILNNVVTREAGDVVVEMDRHGGAGEATGRSGDYDEIEQLGLAIESTFVNETSHPVYIGIGEPKRQLPQLYESFREARRAIDVGRVYRTEKYVFVYRKLLLERFLADVPADMRARYNQMMFNRKTARLFNEEMVHTIEKFFENSLNLSETARQIYIHRNTLVYRLDKVQRMIGLDLRDFDDAVTFKMMMLLGKSGSDRPKLY